MSDPICTCPLHNSILLRNSPQIATRYRTGLNINEVLSDYQSGKLANNLPLSLNLAYCLVESGIIENKAISNQIFKELSIKYESYETLDLWSIYFFDPEINFLKCVIFLKSPCPVHNSLEDIQRAKYCFDRKTSCKFNNIDIEQKNHFCDIIVQKVKERKKQIDIINTLKLGNDCIMFTYLLNKIDSCSSSILNLSDLLRK